MEESTMVGDNPRPDDCDDWTVRVCPVSQDVTIECHTLPEWEDTGGGVLCTGFLDVEKLIVIKNKHHHHPKETVLLHGPGPGDASASVGHDADALLSRHKPLSGKFHVLRAAKVE